jgi:hypothetical protein
MPPLARSFFPLRGICRCYATNSIDRNGIMLRSISPALVDVALWAVACRRQPTYLEPGKIDPKQKFEPVARTSGKLRIAASSDG